MKMHVYSIFDTATGAYMRPFFMQSDGQATRVFGDLAADASHDIGKHPEDYSLYRIGMFDDNTAAITPYDKECVATAQECIAATRNIDKAKLVQLDEEIERKKANA